MNAVLRLLFCVVILSVAPARAQDKPREDVPETLSAVVRVKARILPHTYDFTLQHLDSSPIDTELGLKSQSVPFGIELSLELELQEGQTLWSSGPKPA